VWGGNAEIQGKPLPILQAEITSAKMKEYHMTDMKYGWRREDSSAAPNVARKTNLYEKARPAAQFGAPDKLVNIRNVSDRKRKRPLESVTISKPISANDKSA
jgi:hypothetical protein